MESIMPQRDILERYRHLRGITTRHHSAALARLAGPTLLEQAKHLGLFIPTRGVSTRTETSVRGPSADCSDRCSERGRAAARAISIWAAPW